jgi:kumamolisin
MKNNIPGNVGLKFWLGIFIAAFGIGMTGSSFADPYNSYIQNNVDGSQTLTGHMPWEVKNGTSSYISHASMNMNVQIIMPLSNQSQLDSLLQDLYDPNSPDFHHFLTPTQFAQQFASSAVDVAEVQEYLKKEGIYVTGQSPNGLVLYVTGSVGAFEQAFGLHINNYQKSNGTKFFAPDADPTIPASLAGKILAVGGLDNLPKYMAHRQQYPMKALPEAAGSGPGGFLAPSDVKTAYNLNSVTATGAGQNVALFELDGYSSKDITAYTAHFGLSNVPLQNVLIDGFNGTPNYNSGGADEVTLDIELVTAFAPGSNDIFVYEAPNTTQSWIDEWTKIAADDKAKVISCSWGEPEMDSPTLSFDNTIFEEMAAQGQAVFVAAGDSGAYCTGGKTLCVDEPASQPYATAVGISKLTMGSAYSYSSESASVYGGGGVSAEWSIPSYQTTLAGEAVKAAMVSTTKRNVPDVVLTADASTAYAFYIDGSWWGYYGSSLSSPIWASFISRVNQGLAANAPIGSVNSALYKLAQSSSYANDFHDITTGNNGYYPAEPGFDDATGLGSFNGLNLYNDLVKTSVAVSVPPVPAGLSATAGNSQVLLSWSASAGATSYYVKRATVNGGPYTTIASSVINTTYTDSSVVNGTTYYYVVSAVNSAGQSPNSSQVSAKPVLPVPLAPASLSATAGNAQVMLSWSSSLLATSYNVERATVSGGPYTKIASVSAGTTYTDNSVSNGTIYYYVVSASDASGVSANSLQVSAAPVAPKAVTAVTNLTGAATTYRSSLAVLLQWKQSTSPNIVKNNIYRSIGSGALTLYGSISAATGVYDISVSYSTTYNYYVTAVNSSGTESPASNKITVVMSKAQAIR